MAVMADEPTCAEVEEALVKHRQADRNIVHIVGSPEHPTAWDIASARYDRLITEWHAAKAAELTCRP